MQELQIARKLAPLIRPYRWVTLVIIGLGMLASLSEGIGISLLIPLLQSLNSDTFQTSQKSSLIALLEAPFQGFPPTQRLTIIAVTITLVILLKNCLAYANLSIFSWYKQRLGHQLRSRIFSNFLSLHYTYLESQKSGYLLNLLTTESWQVSRSLELLVNILISACTLIVFTIILVLLSWRLMLLVCILSLLISILIQQVSHQAQDMGNQAVEVNSSLAVHMYEGLMGMHTIRAFGNENYEQKRFDRASSEVTKTFWHLELLYGLIDPIHEGLSTMLVLGVLIFALLRDPTALPAILTFMFMLYRLQPQIKLIDTYRVNLLATGGAVDAVMNFLDAQDKPQINSGSQPFFRLKKSIIFKQVCFQYPSSTYPAIEHISFTIPQGKTTAFVGPSGAGKSTLINLIFRFYQATSGEILVDGQNLEVLNLSDWRSQIAMVSQNIHIFSATVRENIAYGKLSATDNEVMAAAQQAHAHEFIMDLPLGYDTPVGDRGLRLSGGQRQRLALARAIIRNPGILILDEATNALDTLSETLIQEALERFSQNRTVIVIAHRLSTIEQADQIVVLDKGKIIEQGTLTNLLQRRGLFHQLYQLQYRHALPNS